MKNIPATDEEAYIEYPSHRQWFNKLWLSEQLDYLCGPAGTKIPKDGWYIVRPIMNLEGMSYGARKMMLKKGSYGNIKPGYFWCEWFEGTQYSVTYEYDEGWNPISCWKADRNEQDLTKFREWKRDDYLPSLPDLFDGLWDVGRINVEFIDDRPIEVHLRESPDPSFDSIIPIWENEHNDVYKFKEIGYNYITSYDDANGLLKNPRIGFMVKNKGD